MPGGVADGSGSAAGTAGVGEGAAHNVTSTAVVLAVGAMVGFAPTDGVLAQRVITLMRQQRHLQEGVDTVEVSLFAVCAGGR